MQELFFQIFMAAVSGSIAVGCSAASNEQGGGSRITTADDGGAAECSGAEIDAGSGTGWSDLYRDFFGPTGKASCAGTGACHGSSTQQGALASGGYVCGNTAASCYAGMTAPAARLVMNATVAPTETGLYEVLRKCSGGGQMPLSPSTVYFTDADMSRIAAWLQAGAEDD